MTDTDTQALDADQSRYRETHGLPSLDAQETDGGAKGERHYCMCEDECGCGWSRPPGWGALASHVDGVPVAEWNARRASAGAAARIEGTLYTGPKLPPELVEPVGAALSRLARSRDAALAGVEMAREGARLLRILAVDMRRERDEARALRVDALEMVRDARSERDTARAGVEMAREGERVARVEAVRTQRELDAAIAAAVEMARLAERRWGRPCNETRPVTERWGEDGGDDD